MEFKECDRGTRILMKASSSDEYWDEVTGAYIDFSKNEIMKLLDLRNKQEELRASHGVQYLPISFGMWWLNGIPEPEELYDDLVSSSEYKIVAEADESWLDDNELRVEGSEAHISTYGVMFRAWVKHTSIEVSTFSIPWEVITQILKNFDPQSVHFIKDEDTHKPAEN